MSGESLFPSYPSLTPLITRIIQSSLLGKRRSFCDDSCFVVAKLNPPIKILGGENIPEGGGYLITVNHYYRPGFGAWWLAFAISSTIHTNMCWLVTSALTEFRGKKSPEMKFLSGIGIRQLAKVYGFITMPPMPPDPADVTERALAVRLLINTVRAHPDYVFGIAPEGGDNRHGGLAEPPSGVGRFIHYLNRLGLKLLPCGVFEDSGRLCVRFGHSYDLASHITGEKHDLDKILSIQVMQPIAGLLPSALRGEFNL
jgi:hypothetical protein